MPQKTHAAPPASHARPTARRLDWLPPHAGDRRRGAASARVGVEGTGDGGPGGHAGESAEFRKASGIRPPLAAGISRQPRSARDRHRRAPPPAAGLAARLPPPDECLRVRFRGSRRSTARNPLLPGSPHGLGRVARDPGSLHGHAGRTRRNGSRGFAPGPSDGLRNDGAAVAGVLACEPASPAGANGCIATGRQPVSASRPTRTRPCRDAGSGSMKVPAARREGCRAAERSPGPENVTRDRTFVENQPLARPFRRRGNGPSDAGLLAIANAIGSKVVNAAPVAAARATRQGAWKPATGARQPVELTPLFRDRPVTRRPFGQDEGPAARGGFCSR